VLGFVATIYFARKLGSSVLGVYFLVIALVGWLKLGNNMGVAKALAKRISEGGEKSQHLLAALSILTVAFVLISVGVYITRGQVNRYLGDDLYVYVILLLAADLAFTFVSAVMRGEKLVHVLGLVSVSKTVLRVIIQVSAVVLGLGAVGLLAGKAVAVSALSIVGVVLTLTYFGRSINIELPRREHYRSLINYAKFSWIKSVESITYQRMDTIVLGFFVPANLIGIYSICWNIAIFLEVFGKSLSMTLFPEMSEISNEEGAEEVSSYVEDALSYAGLIIIPGLVGSIVVGSGILNIYGGDFSRGSTILVILIGSTLVHGYHRQMVNTLDAIDRPDMSFRVHIFFAITNMSLNFVLVYFYGWIGAAIATLVSIIASLVLAYRLLSSIIEFSVPYTEILKQLFSAAVMGPLVYALVRIFDSLGLNTQRFIPVLVAVGFGAFVYFLCLLTVSERFRGVVTANLPTVSERG
jgi:O-antigen/teichoic acid export membrane protein